MSDDKEALYRSRAGPLGPEKFENDPEDISPEDLLKSYGADFIKEMEDLTAEIKAGGEEDKDGEAIKKVADSVNRLFP